MKGLNAILAASGLILALSLPSWAQEVKQLTHTVTLSGTVESIDHDKHVMNIKAADGTFQTVDVPANVKRFDELKVGDKVSVTYNNTVLAKLKPPGEAAVDTGSKTSTMGQEARPGGTTAVERTITATVAAIDKDASSITSLVRTDGNTADVSPIQMYLINLTLATRLTSPGSQMLRLRWTNSRVTAVLAA